jgi:hypothetical protein
MILDSAVDFVGREIASGGGRKGRVDADAHCAFPEIADRVLTFSGTKYPQWIIGAILTVCHDFRSSPRKRTSSVPVGMPEKCHVWTAPCWQELFSRFTALVGAAMCSAFRCGSLDRWP